MNTTRQSWKVLDKRRFLSTIMHELAGSAQISFEGNLRNNPRLFDISGVSVEETVALKRNTLWPKQDFVVLPLDATTVGTIMLAIGGTVPRSIIHIQIAKAGRLEFGAYDNFHPHALFFGGALEASLIESLLLEGVLTRYESS